MARTFLHGVKNAFHMSERLFWRRDLLQKEPKTLFWTLSEKLFKIWWTFFRWSVENTISACIGIFRGNDNFWGNSWQFWHKLLSWMSVLLPTWPEEPFDKKLPESFYNLLLFFEQKTFQIFGKDFSSRFPNMQTPC